MSSHLNNSTRRSFVQGLMVATVAGTAGVGMMPRPLSATPAEMQDAIHAAFGDAPISEGKVLLDIPPLAENGNSVSLKVSVESPMTPDDYVKSIHIFSPENPIPTLVTFHLGPKSGVAEVSTRIRLADTQIVTAVAQLSDGSLWSGTAETVVTLAACIDIGL